MSVTTPTAVADELRVSAGQALPFGASVVADGVNFAVYSNHAESVTLVLFRPGGDEPAAEIAIPPEYRIGGVHAMVVHGLEPGEFEYGFRVSGPWDPVAGHRFDPERVVADPYSTLMTGRERWGAAPRTTTNFTHRSAVARRGFDWEGDRPLRLPARDLVIYEVHVRGFTRHDSSGVDAPGTFAGLMQKIPYLRRLGVNCVELMPVFEFDETEKGDPDAGANRLYNFWGYSPIGFFAPKASYAASGRDGGQLDEFRELVKQLHRAGIEVLLDVVFNHTAEGNEHGPTFSFRGLDNQTYYMLTPDGSYYNFSGTGNTLNCNHPVVRGFVLDCLRYWAATCHVDGFRFDLATILGRAPDGSLLVNPPLLEALADDPVLRDCLLIAEAWDAGGAYQVGTFPAFHRWAEWNGRFRDGVRSFLKGDDGRAGEMATRLCGSPDLYPTRGPLASINYVTAHDGFTLRDLVSYDDRHNESNGEDNRDGDQNNLSWNCGVEGPTDDAEIVALRDRQARNALLLLLTSHGIPMIVSGDEVGRTQQGNNNAYCHDDLISWFDWDLTSGHADLLEFTRRAIAFRGEHRCLRRDHHPRGDAHDGTPAEVSWHGVTPDRPDWSSRSRFVAVTFFEPPSDDEPLDCVYLAANAHWEDAAVRLPDPPAGHAWCLFADTAHTTGTPGTTDTGHVGRPAPGSSPGVANAAVRLVADDLVVRARSTVVLFAVPASTGC